MSVKIEGIERLRANYYNKIVINQDPAYGNYSVSVKGNPIKHDTERVGERFGESFKNKSDDEQIREIIEDYLRYTKICGYTDLIRLPGYGEKRFNVVYGNFGYREMLLRLFKFNKDFGDILGKIQQKYYQDRFDFCYEEKGIKTFKISADATGTGYTLDLDKLYSGAKEEEYFKHIILMEKDFRLTDCEKKFIDDFIINIFSKFGEKIEIEKVYNSEYEWARSKVTGYIFKCGDVKVYIDNCYPLLHILVTVGNYNLSLEAKKENSMKRQLAMEGF
ncbi:MAG: hypothetical protein IJE89_03425 [Bacilli bacterium]|nr:hypothetical protein [Bacilli bacterium]